MRRRERESGGVLIELALVAPLALAMMLGAIHFGYFFYRYNGLEKSVRDGARFAASRTMRSRGAYETAVRNTVVYGSNLAGTALDKGLTNPATVTLEYFPATGRPDRVRITVSSFTYNGVLGTFTLTNKPSMEVPYLGRYVP